MIEEKIDLRPNSDRPPEQFFAFNNAVDNEYYAIELLENLQRKQFPLKDIGITSRVFNHWKLMNLVPGSEDGKWAYFDFIQYLWLMMVKDLRSFGLPLETILLVKDFLFNETFMQKLTLSREDKAKLRKEFEKGAKRRLTEEEFKEATDSLLAGNTYLPYYFTLIVLNHFSYRTDTDIIIYADGQVIVRNAYLDNQNPAPIPKQPHLLIPLEKYFLDFINDETKAEFLPTMPLISPQENHVLQAMRDNNVKELTVKFVENGKDKRIDLITKKDGKVTPDTISRFTELLSKKNVILTMKTKADESLYYEIEKRRTINY